MDLTIETKDYVINANRDLISFVAIFFSKFYNRCADYGKKFYLNKKQLKELIDFLKNVEDGQHIQHHIDQLVSMEMLMVGKETVEFRFY